MGSLFNRYGRDAFAQPVLSAAQREASKAAVEAARQKLEEIEEQAKAIAKPAPKIKKKRVMRGPSRRANRKEGT